MGGIEKLKVAISNCELYLGTQQHPKEIAMGIGIIIKLSLKRADGNQ